MLEVDDYSRLWDRCPKARQEFAQDLAEHGVHVPHRSEEITLKPKGENLDIPRRVLAG